MKTLTHPSYKFAVVFTANVEFTLYSFSVHSSLGYLGNCLSPSKNQLSVLLSVSS